MQVRRFLSVPHVERHGAELALLIALAALLELAAGVGLAYVAGFSQVRAVLGDVHWGWLIALAGALVVGGTSVAPNTFVLGIDPDRDVMVVHRLVSGNGGTGQKGK